MNFQTQISIPKSNQPIDYHSKIMAFGSCFAENMGKKFDYFKFQNTVNPFGILFHPLAIEKVIASALSEKNFASRDIFYHNERWHCFDAHSQLSHSNQEILLQNLNNALQATKQNLTNASHCIITLGTAWVYNHLETNQTVANCHKVPQKAFEKRLLTIGEIATSLENLVLKVKAVNPDIAFIFTISPVRHLKDGFTENQQSKAHLITALHQFLDFKSPPSGGWGDYFPSYEILMDELRDYRFYADDMVHPNQLAIDYIWHRFSETYFSGETFATMKEVDTIQKGLAHKPFNPNSESHLAFINGLNEKAVQIRKKFSHIQF